MQSYSYVGMFGSAFSLWKKNQLTNVNGHSYHQNLGYVTICVLE